MEVPIEITFRNVRKSESLESFIREKAAKLDEVCDAIISCRVAIERPHEHQQSGNPYRVRLTARVPQGHEVVVRRETSGGNLHEGLPLVIKEVFDTARRQLKKVVEKRQQTVKIQADQKDSAYVARLFPEQGYGFLTSQDGREIYFHRSSVAHDGFDRLAVGTDVKFAAANDEEGPHASSVQIIG